MFFMKKAISITVLSLLVAGMTTGMAFAGDYGQGNGNQAKLKNMNGTVQERLEFKISRIDELVGINRLTPEQAEEFKAIITERMENCDATGSDKEQLRIGFGRTNERGFMRGAGK